jgi:hypothetical protein
MPIDPRDEAVFRLLRRQRANLSKTTEVRFFLYLDSAADAALAVAELTDEGYACEVREPDEVVEQWLCLATRHMPLTDEAMDEARARFERLATILSGEYDGWEAALVR